MNMKTFFASLSVIVSLSLSSGEVFGWTKYVVIGTGEVTGLYYTTGGMFSKLLDKNKEKHGIGLSVEITSGSVYNINAVLAGKLDFALAQSDCHYKAYNASIGSPWVGEAPRKRIRSIFSIYPEAVTLIAPVRTGITEVGDLRELRVNLGGVDSGPLESAKDILSAFGLDENMLLPKYLSMMKAIKFTEEGGISAFFYTVGHPSKIIKIASESKLKNRLVEINGPSVRGLLRKHPYYFKTSIPASFYPGFANKTDVPTVGVKAVLFTSEDMDADLVYAFTKEVFENLNYFKTLHEAYRALTKKGMLEGLSAPFHEGALRYYKETGLIEGKTEVAEPETEAEPKTEAEPETEAKAKEKEEVKKNKPSEPILSF